MKVFHDYAEKESSQFTKQMIIRQQQCRVCYIIVIITMIYKMFDGCVGIWYMYMYKVMHSRVISNSSSILVDLGTNM